MHGMLKLNYDVCHIILAYCAESYKEAFKYSRASKHFYEALKDILKRRGSAERWNFSEFFSYKPSNDFWNGFEYCHPFWNLDAIDTKDILRSHIYRSLRFSHLDEKRTDQILCYLAIHKPFAKNGWSSEGSLDYDINVSHFVRENITNPRLYVFLEIKESHGFIPISTSFSNVLLQMKPKVDSITWLDNHFKKYYGYFDQINDMDVTLGLARRLEWLHWIHKNYDKYENYVLGILWLLDVCYFALLEQRYYYHGLLFSFFVLVAIDLPLRYFQGYLLRLLLWIEGLLFYYNKI